MTIQLHRELYRAELGIRSVARQPATSIDPNTGILHQEEATRVGMNMSGAMLRRLGHPEGYGQMYPYAKALWLLKVECRRKHPDHRGHDRPYWRGSLCHQAVKLTVIGGEVNGTGPLSPEHAAAILRVENLDTRLRWAFRFIEDTLDDFRDKAEKRAREDAGHGPGALPPPPHEHRRLPGLHEVECVQCRRVA